MECPHFYFRKQGFEDSNFLPTNENCWGTIVIVIETLQTYGPHTTNLQTPAENIHKT